MARVSLSYGQVCFAVLTESHAIACQCLFGVVADAIKAADPENWKETVCSCFGHGLGQHVKERLDNDLAVRDFYVVCKVLRSRLRDVARLCGGELSHPYGREGLSLQIQGAETARHWLYHGEQYVSPRELRSSLVNLIAILTGLPCLSDQSHAIFQRLLSLLSYAEELVSLNSGGEYTLCAVAVRSALLHSALSDLKRNFTVFFNQRKANSNDKDKGMSPDHNKLLAEHDDYSSLFSQIRKASTELNKKDRLRVVFGDDHPKLSIIDICKNVSELRNASAHGVRLTLSETKSGISQICELLSAFRLNSNQVKSLEKLLEAFPGDNYDIFYACHLERGEGDLNSDFATQKPENTKRIFHPKVQYLVGRSQ